MEVDNLDLYYVKDAARVIEESIRSNKKGIYNLHLENTKIIDLAEKIKSLFSDVEIEKIDMKFQDSRNYQADGAKLRKKILNLDQNILLNMA